MSLAVGCGPGAASERGGPAPRAPEATPAASSEPTSGAPTPASPPRGEVAATPDPWPPVQAGLATAAVLADKPARRTLYTWTTAEQVAELAKDRVLLTRTESPRFGSSRFDRVMAERAKRGDAIAALIRTRAFARARFAWPSPWPTMQGWPGESYGDQLVAVTLKPEAWIAATTAGAKAPWTVVDLEGRVVPTDELARHPERLGAVFFANRGALEASAGGQLDAGPSHREYVLCNEAMLESWTVGGEPTARVLEGEAVVLEALVALMPELAYDRNASTWSETVTTRAWAPGAAPSNAVELYEAALAAPNAFYLPDRAHVTALAQRVRAAAVATRGRPEIAHRPTAKFPGRVALVPLPPPPAPPASRRSFGTF